MKKIYRVTEDQMADLIKMKKEAVTETNVKPKKKKYKITEDQLKEIFGQLGNKAIKEMDNYNYPMGSDRPDAPWNQDDSHIKSGESVSGDFVGAFVDRDQYLIKNKSNGQVFFTINDAFETGKEDIYDLLHDYLDVQQEEDEDEDGRYMTSISDWKDFIEADDLLNGLASYMNDIAKRGHSLKIVTTTDEWENGEGELLLLSQETLPALYGEKIINKAKELMA